MVLPLLWQSSAYMLIWVGSHTSMNPNAVLTGLSMLSNEMLPLTVPSGAGLASTTNWSLYWSHTQ